MKLNDYVNLKVRDLKERIAGLEYLLNNKRSLRWTEEMGYLSRIVELKAELNILEGKE